MHTTDTSKATRTADHIHAINITTGHTATCCYFDLHLSVFQECFRGQKIYWIREIESLMVCLGHRLGVGFQVIGACTLCR